MQAKLNHAKVYLEVRFASADESTTMKKTEVMALPTGCEVTTDLQCKAAVQRNMEVQSVQRSLAESLQQP